MCHTHTHNTALERAHIADILDQKYRFLAAIFTHSICLCLELMQTRKYAEYPKKTIQGKHMASVIVVNTFH